MQSRKTSIAQTKSSKQSKVDDLNEQIKVLKNQVSDLEKEIKDIEKEDSALDLDITSIEKMKESVLEVSTDRPRKHNLSNIKK
jgi:predicted  nucleic acid-binding Zn-ribbon protein